MSGKTQTVSRIEVVTEGYSAKSYQSNGFSVAGFVHVLRVSGAESGAEEGCDADGDYVHSGGGGHGPFVGGGVAGGGVDFRAGVPGVFCEADGEN